ncbi:MAG: 30S ribosomal protein S8 [candidate division WOR-3 bacterium]|nr:30S ribosomal protein S8 [candidate division WOR-3 bacterium]MDH5683530.1 30S ribosomal protein S8 [candidate division WOR-3 bacterium]
MDSISDMITRIRNAIHAKHRQVDIPYSKLKYEIARVLMQEGYISNFQEVGDKETKKKIMIQLKYTEDENSIIYGLKRVSKQSRRVYVRWDEIPKVIGGLGIAILSTSKGILTDREARTDRVGGEVICYVW